MINTTAFSAFAQEINYAHCRTRDAKKCLEVGDISGALVWYECALNNFQEACRIVIEDDDDDG